MKKIYLLLLMAVVFSVAKAQTTVTVTNPTNTTPNLLASYGSLAAALTDLDAVTAFSGPVILTCGGGTETAPAGGYVVNFTGTTTASNNVVIDGATTTLTADGALTVGSVNDAIVKIIGSDYVTLQGFTMQENPANTIFATAATNNMTEFGIALFYASTTNGAQNNTIQNNTISLNRLYLNTFGIYSNTRHSAVLTAADATSAAGSNSSNKVYSNNISNVNVGIVFLGTPVTAIMDNNTDVGGTVSGTGNTITNWGGGPQLTTYTSVTTSNYGIQLVNQLNDNASFNSLTSATGLVTTVNQHGGILKQYSAGGSPVAGTVTVSNYNNNTINLINAPTTGQMTGITTQGMTALSTATININNNLITGTVIGVTTSSFVALFSTSAPGTLNINGNTIRNVSTTTTSGVFLPIAQQTNGVVNALNINNNKMGDAINGAVTFVNANSGGVTGISVAAGGAATTCAVSITGNDIRGIVHAVAGTGPHTYISSVAVVASLNVSNNTFTNLSVNTTGAIVFISHGYSMPAAGSQTINNNSVVTGFNKTAASGSVTFTTTGTSSPNGTITSVTNNNFSNITVLGSSSVTGITNSDGASSSPSKICTGNTMNNITAVTGSVTCINYAYIGAPTSSISNNTLTNVTCQSTITGIQIGSSFSGANPLTVASNTVSGLSSTGTGGTVTGITCSNTSALININSNTVNTLSSAASTVTGLSVTGSTLTNVFKNNINNLVSTSTSGAVSGMILSSGTTNNAFNNFISDLRAPAASSATAIYGINASGGTNGIYYNTVVLGKAATLTSTGANFGVTGIGYGTGATTLRNNIVWVDATPAGTGTVAAVRRNTAGTANTAPLATNFNSNNNIYNVVLASGVAPVAANINKYLYVEGTTAATVTNGYGIDIGQADVTAQNLKNDATFNSGCSRYKTFMGTREGGTFNEDNLTASGGPGYTFVPSGTSYASNSGQAITSPAITDDYSGAVRNVSTPDVGALEFSGTSLDGTPPVIAHVGSPTSVCTAAPTFAVTITDPGSGVNVTPGLAPRLYYRKGGAVAESDIFGTYPADNTSAFNGWKYVEATGAAPNFSFAIDYSLLTSPMALGDSLTYFIVAQDLAATPNVGKNAVTFPVGFCPSSVVIPSSGAVPTTGSLGYKIVPFTVTRTDGNAATSVAPGTQNATFVYGLIGGSAGCTNTVTQVDFTVSGTSPSTDIATAKCYYTTTSTFSIGTATAFGTPISNPAAGTVTFTGSQALAAGNNYFWMVYDIACAATATNTLNGDINTITVNGTPVSATGTAPVANAIGAVSAYATVADGDWSNPATWGACGVPVIPCGSTATITINNNITVTTAGINAPNVTVAAGKSLTVSGSGNLTLGCSSAGGVTGYSNRILLVDGTLTVNGGTLNINGGLRFTNTGYTFNMSSGTINIDPNDGTSAGSETTKGAISVAAIGTHNVTGGNINILDPAYSTTATAAYAIGYSTPTGAGNDAVWGCTVTLGGGDDANPLNNAGYHIDCNIAQGTVNIGTLIVADGDYTSKRHMTTASSSADITVVKNLTVNAGAEIVQGTGNSVLVVTGNLVNNGTMTIGNTTADRGLIFCGDAQYSGSAIVYNPGTAAQTLSGTGYFRKATADGAVTAQTGNYLSTFSVYHLKTSPGVTLQMPITAAQIGMRGGKINTTSANFLALGNGTALPGNPAVLTATTGTLTGAGGTTYTTAATFDGGHVVGPFNRWVTATTTSGQQGIMPVGSDTSRPAQILFTGAPTTGGYLTASWTDGTSTNIVSPTLNQAGVTPPVISYSLKAHWNIDNLGTLTGGTYTASMSYKNANSVTDYTNTVLLKRVSGVGGTAWEDDGLGGPIGTHVATTGSNTSPVAGRSGLTTFSEFAIGAGIGVVPVGIESFRGSKIAGSNYLDWKINCTSAPSVVITLERSGDGRNFSPIHNENASATRCLQGFNYTDASPLADINYYRLKIVTPDGKERYSSIVALLNKDRGFELVSVAPNPVKNTAVLTITAVKGGKMDISVTDLTGRVVMKQSVTVIAGNTPVTMNFATLGAGTYNITAINTDGEIKTTRFVKF